MKQGAFFLSTSHVLQTALFEVVKTIQFKMSWGTATLYIHVSGIMGLRGNGSALTNNVVVRIPACSAGARSGSGPRRCFVGAARRAQIC